MRGKLSGIYPPIPTSFRTDGAVDEPHFTSNLEKWNKFDFTGVVVLGSNGEFPFLSNDEKICIVDRVKKNIKAGKQVIAGAGCEGTEETIRICNRFYEIGVDAALIHTPHFYRNQMTDATMLNHYKRVADNSKLPIILYNVPSNTGIELTYDVVSSLAFHNNIIGLKDSSGNIDKISRIVDVTKNVNFSVLAGSAGFLADAMEQGTPFNIFVTAFRQVSRHNKCTDRCVGGVCALANVLPKETLMIFDLMNQGSLSDAKMLQQRILVPNLMVTKKYGVPALKYVLDRYGYYGGPVRSPLLPLTDKEKQEVDNEFKDFGVKV